MACMFLGQSPEAESRATTLLAVSRLPVADGKQANKSLIKALSEDFSFDAEFDPLTCDMAQSWLGEQPQQLAQLLKTAWRTNGDTRERLELFALALLTDEASVNLQSFPRTKQVLDRIRQQVAPALDTSGHNELSKLLVGLAGKFVPPGPSGAPSRGRVDVLPTGRNFLFRPMCGRCQRLQPGASVLNLLHA